MLNKLQVLEDKYKELTEKISDIEVINDQKTWQKYMKEHADLEPIVMKYREYKEVVDNIKESKEILEEESDEELRELAKMELSDLESRVEPIEDELKIRFLLRDYLKAEGFNVLEASDGDEGIFIFKNNKVDLILLDIMMPKIDGITVLETIRTVSNLPIILLTAKGQEEDKLFGYEMGADDYVTKPFSPKILIAKIKALLKRTTNNDDDFNPTQNYNGLTINKLAHEVKINGVALALSPKEFELLLYLSDNLGIALSRDTILDNVWGIDYYGDLRTVDTNIKRLREKLGSKANYIVTVRGSGYKFEVPNEE